MLNGNILSFWGDHYRKQNIQEFTSKVLKIYRIGRNPNNVEEKTIRKLENFLFKMIYIFSFITKQKISFFVHTFFLSILKYSFSK